MDCWKRRQTERYAWVSNNLFRSKLLHAFSEKVSQIQVGFCFRRTRVALGSAIMKRGRQGILFRIRLSERRLSLWLLGVVPLGVVPLESVKYIQQRDMAEFWKPGVRRVFFPWRYWFWPSSPGRPPGPKPGLFLIRTRRGTLIWVRLRSGLHYQLREWVHRRQTGCR